MTLVAKSAASSEASESGAASAVVTSKVDTTARVLEIILNVIGLI